MKNLLRWLMFVGAAFALFTVGCELEESTPCASDADCFNGFACVATPETGELVCATNCATNVDCATGYVCDPVTTGCVVAGGGGDAGGGGTDGGGVDCSSDGVCEAGCGSTDPDCGCSCDRDTTRCDAVSSGSTTACQCDPDCGIACTSDGSCDTFCPADRDPDCETSECACDVFGGVCEAAEFGSTTTCACDEDCVGGAVACSEDDHCDSYCPEGTDPDCGEPTECSCDFNEGICEPNADGSSDACECDPDCAGGEQPCKFDGHCDSWCPDGFDPDCE